MADQNEKNEHPLGTKENPCTAANSTPEERAYHYCLCEECGEVKRCQPGNDFWVTHPDKKLRCEACFTCYLSEEHDIDNIMVPDYDSSDPDQPTDDKFDFSDVDADLGQTPKPTPADDEPDEGPAGRPPDKGPNGPN